MSSISSSRESAAGKIDDALPESSKRSPARVSLLMGPDRLVIRLINATEMSAAAAGARSDPSRRQGETHSA